MSNAATHARIASELQRGGGAEQRHDAVTGELVHRAPVSVESDGGSDPVRMCGTEASVQRPVLLRLWCAGGGGHQGGEYKQVTVLFADVVGSMDFAAAGGCGPAA